MLKIETGIDLVDIVRLGNLESSIKQRFLKRVFTEREIIGCGDRDDHLSGIFAAKEAAAKALGTGIGVIKWHDLEIISDENGKPVLRLNGEAERISRKNGWLSWSVSITHTDTVAAAVVTALLEVPAAK